MKITFYVADGILQSCFEDDLNVAKNSSPVRRPLTAEATTEFLAAALRESAFATVRAGNCIVWSSLSRASMR